MARIIDLGTHSGTTWAEKAAAAKKKAKESAGLKRLVRYEQLKLYSHATVMPNLAGKSLLFRPVMKGRRPVAQDWESVPTINLPDVDLAFKGAVLDQVDLTGWLVAIQFAQQRGGHLAAFTAHEFLARMRRQGNSRDYQWLQGWYTRVTETFIRVGVQGVSQDGVEDTYLYKGHLVSRSMERVARKAFALDLDKCLVGFFSVDDWSICRLDQRLSLGQNQWALAFQTFLACNRSPVWLSWHMIHQLWGQGYEDQSMLRRNFRRRVLKPLYQLGIIKRVFEKPTAIGIWTDSPEAIEGDSCNLAHPPLDEG